MRVSGAGSPITNTKLYQEAYADFMPHLSRIFDEATEKLIPVPGLPPGVYTANPLPDQTAASLNIVQVDPKALT